MPNFKHKLHFKTLLRQPLILMLKKKKQSILIQHMVYTKKKLQNKYQLL